MSNKVILTSSMSNNVRRAKMAEVVENKNVRRIMASDATALTSELTPRMLGAEVDTKQIGAKLPDGTMAWYTPKGGNAEYASIIDSELANILAL